MYKTLLESYLLYMDSQWQSESQHTIFYLENETQKFRDEKG
jgi:hypothetical protein